MIMGNGNNKCLVSFMFFRISEKWQIFGGNRQSGIKRPDFAIFAELAGQSVKFLQERINQDLVFPAKLDQKGRMPEPGDLHLMSGVLQQG